MQLSKKKKRKKPLVSQIEHEEERPLLHSQGPRGATHRTNTGRKMATMTTDTSLCAYLTAVQPRPPCPQSAPLGRVDPI